MAKWYKYAGTGFKSRLPGTQLAGAARSYIIGPTGSSDWGAQVNSLKVTRDEAASTPVVAAVKNRLLPVICSFPLLQTDANFNPVTNPFLKQMDPTRTPAVLMRDMVLDLFYDGLTHLEKVSMNAKGYPTAVRHLPMKDITWDPGTNEWLHTTGRRIPSSAVIQIEGLHGGILNEAAPARVRDSRNLNATFARFTSSPLPAGYFTDTDPQFSLDEEEVKAFLSAWETARGAGAYGYVPSGLQLKTPAMNPEQLQLRSQRHSNDVDSARASGGDLEALGINTTSRVYKNDTGARQDMLTYQVALYTLPIEQRLSMNDVTPNGHEIRFDFAEFLRPAPEARQAIYTSALANGTTTIAEIRRAERLPPIKPDTKGAPNG